MLGNLYYRITVSASGSSYELSDDAFTFTVEQWEGVPDSFSAETPDPYKIYSHALREGMDIEVELGTDVDHAVVFRGRIYKVEGRFPANEAPTIRIVAYDESMKMGLRKRNRVWSNMALSDIVRSVASTYFPKTDINIAGDPSFPDNGIRQQEETDLAFLKRLASTYACVLYVTTGDADDTFHFTSQYATMTTAPDVTVYHGRAGVEHRLVSFLSTASAGAIELPRVLSGIDYHTGQPTVVTTTTVQDVGATDDAFFAENLTAFSKDHPDKAAQLVGLLTCAEASQTTLRADLGTATREATPTFTTPAQQSAIAQNQFSTSLRGMRGYGTTPGIRKMTAQTSIDICDVGGRFSGTWFLSRVRHIVDGQGYRTEFECRR